MSELTQLVVETSQRILGDLCTKQLVENAEAGEWPAGLWNTFEGNGLTLAAVSVAAGGSGGTLGDAMAVIKSAAGYVAPLPLLETLVSGLLSEACGGVAQEGPAAIVVQPGAFRVEPFSGTFRLYGHGEGIVWLPVCQRLHLVIDQDDTTLLVTLDPANLYSGSGLNMAGEPIADIGFQGLDLKADQVCTLPVEWSFERVRQLMALGRAAMIAGALESILELSVRYSTERIQFGRPISKYQAIQQDLAVMAGQVAASTMAVDSAVDSLSEGEALLDVATAKSRTGEAAGIAARIAHQVHGALGYTREHQLNLRTRRIWVWRDDYGRESDWQMRIGEYLCSAGPQELWSRMIGI